MSAPTLMLILAGLAVITPPLSAQDDRFEPVKGTVGISLIVGEPVGEFQDFVGGSLGADVFGRLPLDPNGVLSLRGDLGILIYGHESKRVCFAGVGCRVQARLQTDNAIFYGGIGPELALPLRAARPYVNAFLGYAYFNTSSSLEDLWGGDNDFRTENFGDGAMTWGVGGGLEVSLHRGWTPVDLNLGLRYHHHGMMEYLTEGDIVDNPDGSITLYPVISEANLVSYHIGVSLGIPRGRGDDGRHR